MSEQDVVGKETIDGERGGAFTRIRRIVYLVLSVILVLFIVRGAMLLHEAASLQGRITALKDEIGHRKKLYRIEEMEREWSGYVDKVGQVSRLPGVRSAWGDKLAVLPRAIPSRLAFDFVSFVSASSANTGILTLETMVLSGENQGYGLANGFIDELKKTKRFGEDIKINYVERAVINGKGVEVIQIMARLS